MKSAMKATVIASAALAVAAEEGSPIAKVIQMISELQSKVLGEGETAQKEYEEFAEWCEENSKNLQFEIKTAKGEVEELTATIEELDSNAVALNSKIEELAAAMSADEADLKAATDVRNAEAADFAAEEKELVADIDTLARAVGILEKEMAKGGASMMQLKTAKNVVQAMNVLVQASALNSVDADKLTALVQSSQMSDDDSLGAPDVAAYEGQSGGIVDTINDLKEKAEAQLDAARKKETAAANKFAMVEQSLQDELKVAAKDTAAAKKSLAEGAEKKAIAKGDLDVTSKDLAEDTSALSDLHNECMTKAEEYEAAVKSRGDELAALAKAKEIIIEATGGAASFLQMESSPKMQAIHFVRDLARRTNAPALAQLASRMANVRSGDVFAKVKGLIGDMIEKLEQEAADDATEKAYCDKEMAETTAKKEEQETAIKKLSTKIDQAAARSAKLQEEIATLGKELSDLAASQAAMDKMRNEEKATFTANEAETSKGLDGIKLALKTLRDYYAKADKAHGSSDSAAGGIVSLLEVCESDFTKALAEMRATEEASAADYEKQTKENAVLKQTKEQDVKYKTKESVGLDKSASEMTSDRSGVQTELDAVNEYLDKLKDRCVAKAESYSDKKAAREAEIAGLNEALQILDSAALLQTKKSLRGVRKH